MEEFEEKDYGEAINYADSIKGIATTMHDIFDDIDQAMNQLYKDKWQSSGSYDSYEQYQTLRRNYDVFYQNVLGMNEHVKSVTSRNQEADKEVNQVITDVGAGQ